jgi:PEP-CTERM motif
METHFWEGDIMLKLRTIILVAILSLGFLQGQSDATVTLNWTAGDYNIPDLGWTGGVSVLNTYNNVTVTMLGGGGVGGEFNMYNNSKLTMYGGFIGTLNLYPDTTAIIKGGNISQYLWIDPTTTGWVKLYAYDVEVIPLSNDYLSLHGNWLADNSFFDIELQNGISTYSHIQIVPEPTTIALLALGGLGLFRRRR